MKVIVEPTEVLQIKDATLRRYVENVGHQPSDCPDEAVWQWRYRGTAEERELLADLLETEADEIAAEQETLF